MRTNFFIEEMNQRFPRGENFTREQLLTFYKQFDPQVKPGTFAWYLYILKKKHIIEHIQKGTYTISGKIRFFPVPGKKIQKIDNALKKNFAEVKYNLWTTGWLNEFTTHQQIKEITILEVEKDSMDSVFNNLRDNGFKNIFLKPDKTLMERYISEGSDAVVIKPAISRSPVQLVKKIPVPTLEKILVDIFCDEIIFYFYKGIELINIYNYALKKYALNLTMLFNYAGRRKREEALKAFMKEHLRPSLKGMI
ncbi:MAG TPA: DUF6577 family protein, partial [Candidatus Deferrimicrobium sp.]|nr:DUF6577 family protein [Candidatus Deferrimicrobium sp.]